MQGDIDDKLGYDCMETTYRKNHVASVLEVVECIFPAKNGDEENAGQHTTWGLSTMLFMAVIILTDSLTQLQQYMRVIHVLLIAGVQRSPYGSY